MVLVRPPVKVLCEFAVLVMIVGMALSLPLAKLSPADPSRLLQR